MSKLLKAALFIAYAVVVIQYLKFSLGSNDDIIELDYITHFSSKGTKAFKRNFFKYKHNLTALQMSYKKPIRFASDLKFIMKYTNSFLHYGTSLYKNGQSAFIQNKCKYINCFLTNNIETLPDIRYYDAVLFDVENSWDSFLSLRDPDQKFVFVASESSANYPLCDKGYNNYYNLTWTYKLDSDIRMTYIIIENKKGEVIGPRINMSWVHPMKPTPAKVKQKLFSKNKAAAWFVSNCRSSTSHRGEVAKEIEKALLKYNLTIDIYGYCGKKTCPKDRFPECLELLERDYYFYLSFENSLSEDYVTEKILYPLQHYAVPIVYGGANYSRFLPPGSYINAKLLNATEVATEMYAAIKNQTKYEDYFKWQNHYDYIQANKIPDVCKLCEILNDKNYKRSSYKNFLHWWNPKHVDICNEGEGRVLIRDPHNAIDMELHHLERDPDIIMRHY